MEASEKIDLLRGISWDHNIPAEELYELALGKRSYAGHYDKNKLFIRMLETYPWFTLIRFYPVNEINFLLTEKTINQLRQPSLKKKYEFVKKRLQEIIPTSG